MNLGIGLGMSRLRAAASEPEALSASLTPSAVATQQYLTTDTAWATTSNVLVDDNTEATCAVASSLFTDMILVTFASPSIPASARIDGITITVRARAVAGTGSVFLQQDAYLVVGEVITGLNFHKVADAWTTSESTTTYGSATDIWGCCLTPTAINSGTFGVALRFKRNGAAVQTFGLRYVTCTVNYTTVVGVATRPMAVAAVQVPNDSTAFSPSTIRVPFPGMGTVKGVLVTGMNVIRSDQTDGSARLGMPNITAAVYGSLNFGLSDGTSQYHAFHRARLLAPASQPYTRDPQTTQVGRNQLSVFFDVSALGDGYVDITWSTVANSPVVLYVTAFFADNVHMHTRNGWAAADTPEVVTTGFQPDVLILVSGCESADGGTHDAYIGNSIGFAVRNGSGWDQAFASISHQVKIYDDGVPGSVFLADNRNYIRTGTDRLHYNLNPNDPGAQANGRGYEYSTRATAHSSTSYSIEGFGDVNAGEDGFSILALGWSSIQAQCGVADTPTVDGTIATTFTPDGFLGVITNATAAGLIEDSTEADTYGLFMADQLNSITAGFADPNAQTTCAISGFHDRDGLTIKTTSATTIMSAQVTGLSSGVVLDVTGTPTSTKMPFLALS